MLNPTIVQELAYERQRELSKELAQLSQRRRQPKVLRRLRWAARGLLGQRRPVVRL